jgi:hypothetical protein
VKPRLRTWLLRLLAALVLLPVLVIAAGQLGAFGGTPPTDLGVKERPPEAALCHAQQRHQPGRAMARPSPGRPRRNRAPALPRRRPRRPAHRGGHPARHGAHHRSSPNEPGYLYAQARTRLLRFTDDVEFSLDEAAGVIHVRSASRIGHGDRGVNRARVEAIRSAFMASPAGLQSGAGAAR